jgi:beta-fructofuranosidase
MAARPTFHLGAESGWLNDPNGPLYHKGRYHLCAAPCRRAHAPLCPRAASLAAALTPTGARQRRFYQHLRGSASWNFGLEWAHAVSEDLVRWRRLPPALAPTPGSPDADGCFSGCCTVRGSRNDEAPSPAAMTMSFALQKPAAGAASPSRSWTGTGGR